MTVQHATTSRPVGGDDIPACCPYDHPLGPGQVLAGWAPCQCAGATHGGHRTHSCRACRAEGVVTVRYEPPHLGGGHPHGPEYPRT